MPGFPFAQGVSRLSFLFTNYSPTRASFLGGRSISMQLWGSWDPRQRTWSNDEDPIGQIWLSCGFETRGAEHKGRKSQSLSGARSTQVPMFQCLVSRRPRDIRTCRASKRSSSGIHTSNHTRPACGGFAIIYTHLSYSTKIYISFTQTAPELQPD